jgi:outer membrane protein
MLAAAASAAEAAPAPPPGPAAPGPAAPAAASAPAPPASAPIKLTIEECVLIAVRNNIELRRARLSDRQAELDRSSALAQFLPTLSASTSGQQHDVADATDTATDSVSGSLTQKTPLGTTLTVTGSQSRDRTNGESERDYSSSLSAEVRQPLLSGAGPAAALYDYRAANLNRFASSGDLERQGQSTVFQVRQLYWNALQDELAVAANQRSLESADYFLKSAQAREAAGQASKLDVSNAEIQRSTREAALTLAQAQLEEGRDALKQALDLPLGERLALGSAPTFAPVAREPEQLLRTALQRRPDLAAARDRLHVLSLDLERKRRNAWPTLDLVAGYTTSGAGTSPDQSHNYDDHTTRVGVELTVPLGLVASRNALERAELELRRGRLDLHRREQQVEAELRRVLRNLAASERNIASYEKRLEAAKLAAAAARALYERGKASSFDVVRAEDDLLAAELGRDGSRADYLSRTAELDLVCGRPVSQALPAGKPGAPGADGIKAPKGK